MATPPLKVNPSKEEASLKINPSKEESSLKVNPAKDEVWWNNLAALKEHYDEHGNLTVRDLRLSGWLTYQRHEATMLSERQLEALQSIGYMSTKAYRESDEKTWEEKINAVKSNPHTREPYLVKWLHRQRVLAATDQLSPTRKQRLLEIGVDLRKKCARCRKVNSKSDNETRWMAKYNKLKEYGDRIGNVNVPRRYTADQQLSNWVFNQRKRYHELLPNGDRVLRKDRIELLEEIGFNWELNRRTRRELSNPVPKPFTSSDQRKSSLRSRHLHTSNQQTTLK